MAQAVISTTTTWESKGLWQGRQGGRPHGRDGQRQVEVVQVGCLEHQRDSKWTISYEFLRI